MNPTNPGPANPTAVAAQDAAAAPSALRSALAFSATGVPREERREVVREALLVVQVAGGGEFALMHTPGDEEALALGFLLAEGWIESAADVARLEVCPGRDTVKVDLARPPAEPAARRSLVLHSSCGLCGRDDAVPFLAALSPLSDGSAFPLSALRGLTERMRAQQSLFALTGGSHACGLFDRTGRLLAVAEDIGRHAAFDKVVGQAMLGGLDPAGLGAALSGRASLEMVAKAARARLPLLLAVGAPSAAAVDLAERLGIALCGFARGEELAVYAGRQRIAT